MSHPSKAKSDEPAVRDTNSNTDKTTARVKTDWETPKMKDVSEQVMAQPYIRFT
jgi:hypothetical protein